MTVSITVFPEALIPVITKLVEGDNSIPEISSSSTSALLMYISGFLPKDKVNGFVIFLSYSFIFFKTFCLVCLWNEAGK